MCNEYARMIALEKLAEEFAHLKLPAFEWLENKFPNDREGKASIRIRDTAMIVRLRDEKLQGAMMTWAWPGPHKKPVFNYVSEGRDFSNSDRVLVPATGFYEYTTPSAPKVKLKDKHLFTRKDSEWFWIAGIVKQDCFSLLTVAPGPDVAPYHHRQVVTLRAAEGLDWLNFEHTSDSSSRHVPQGAFNVQTLRKNGEPCG